MDRDFKQYHRGEIYFANLNPAYGCEHGGIRPVLILQNDVGNFYSPTLIVTPATKRADKKPYLPTISPNWPRRFSICRKKIIFGLCRRDVCKVLLFDDIQL